MATHHKEMITQEEMRIMLLEQKNDSFHQALLRIENKIDSGFSEINLRSLEVSLQNRTQFMWIMACIFAHSIGIIFKLWH